MASEYSHIVETPYLIERPGCTLDGVMAHSSERSSENVIVMAHGVLSNRDHNFAVVLSHRLVTCTSCSVLRFNFRFPGEAAEKGFRYRFCGFDDDLDDLLYCVRQLARDGHRVSCLLGHSRGANDVLLFAARHAASTIGPVPIAALSARYHMPAMLTRLFPPETVARLDAGESCEWISKRGTLDVTPADAATVRSLDMHAAITGIPADVPVLIVHGRDDDVIPLADAEEFKAARPAVTLIVVDGAKHAFAGKKQQRALVDVVCEWAAKVIRNERT